MLVGGRPAHAPVSHQFAVADKLFISKCTIQILAVGHLPLLSVILPIMVTAAGLLKAYNPDKVSPMAMSVTDLMLLAYACRSNNLPLHAGHTSCVCLPTALRRSHILRLSTYRFTPVKHFAAVYRLTKVMCRIQIPVAGHTPVKNCILSAVAYAIKRCSKTPCRYQHNTPERKWTPCCNVP